MFCSVEGGGGVGVGVKTWTRYRRRGECRGLWKEKNTNVDGGESEEVCEYKH